MKKYLALFAFASLAFACVEPEPVPEPEPEPDPVPVEKAFEVTAQNIKVAASDTNTSFDVKGEVAWTAKSDNANFSVNPASGSGNETITVSFPANETTSEVKAVITVSTEDTAAKVKSFTVTITQDAAEAKPTIPDPRVLAEWEFSAETASFFNEHFAYEAAKGSDKKPTPESNAAGFLNENHYCPSNTVEGGRIRFWNGSDKTAINPDGRCKRGVGEKGEPCWYGNWVGDMVYINAASGELPAGTKLHIWMAIRPNTQNTLKYWLLEIKDGDNFVPVGEVKSYGDTKYNVELIFNPDGSKDVGTDENGAPVYPETPQQINTIVDATYTLTAPVSEVEYHLTCVSLMMADGSREATDIGDSAGKRANPVVRIAGKETTNGGCRPAGKNMMIEIVK